MKVVSKTEALMTAVNFQAMRISYFKLIDLLTFVDSQISGLLLISMAHNMIVLIVKIFLAFRPDRLDFLDDLYFWFYLVFLTTRIFSMLFCCSGVHEAACEPIIYVRNVPTKYWTIDVSQR
jgi:Trehalose receptor